MSKKKVKEPVVEVVKDVPEEIEDGVVRDKKIETPMDLVNSAVKVRKEGNWVDIPEEGLAGLEAKGLLQGYDQKNQKVLIKGVK